ncbi:MAG: asparagine synthase (glutamine-hydrolyzing) [bacterium]|nr:asparagine synthase (glutamine-hydrolyzing) [bacterium]
MCGICGKLNFDGRPVDEAFIRKMCAVLEHRGPDDEGVYLSESRAQSTEHRTQSAIRNPGYPQSGRAIQVGLGHRRLSIIDLGSGHQPMSNEDGSIRIVYNGEVYNFLSLREDLEKKGHRFSTRTDTEAIIHLYEDYGPDCVKYLRGMFAFAVWDSKRQRLVLARDRLGKKPLVYLLTPSSFIFGSEIKAILQDPQVNKEVDLEALHHYLTYGYVPAPFTIFKGIKKLPPAHTLVWEKGRIKIERYWSLDYIPKLQLKEDEYVQRLLELLKESVKLRLISDVPLGAFLSGGVDSSAVVAMMAELSDQPVKTFSIGFEEASFNELKFARIVSDRFGTEHHEFVVKPDALEVLPKLIRHYNEPYADSSAIPTYYVSQMTRQHVTVALNGDGGDEAFAGYERYLANRIAQIYEKIPPFIREKVIFPLVNKLPESTSRKSLFRRIKRFTSAISESPERRYVKWLSIFNNDQKQELYSGGMKERMANLDSVNLLVDVYRKAKTDNFLDSTMFVDCMTYLPDDLLVKVDIASMANSLEARSPFLDHKLVEFAASLPPNLKLKGKTTKYILKKALKKYLPRDILYRDKMGFGVPIGRWFRNELKDYAAEVLLDDRAKSRGYFDPNAVRKILDEHTSGQIDHGYRIWSLLNLELWHRMFIDGQ